ncbi:MAG: hypothetical protein ALECFALPRED_004516 [Alectoria fallacina]|uniref:Uncharacterized protein n=1 Tax=Alectoria fallacina TaxID=1903189 RepID=A0A8H3FZ29_9LECA|nr:MAG: hypothetical protein ALECFALPRED_004516 [Alectoria fallacina]
MESTDLPTSGSLKDENAKVLTYRVRGIPNGLDKAGAKSLLLAALETQNVTIESLAAASSNQVATIRVPGKPLKLKNWGTSKSQWQVSARGVSMTVDTHFGGFTPLHDPQGDSGSFFE